MEHPFWTEESGWITLEYLKVGDQLRLADGRAAYVAEVRETGRVEEVYNFAVEGFHTYYVGALGVWVHNVCAERLQSIMEAPRPNARHHELGKLYDEIFRRADKLPGGSAGELIREINRGDLKPKHLQKVDDYVRGINNVIKQHQSAFTNADRMGADRVMRDLRDALQHARDKGY